MLTVTKDRCPWRNRPYTRTEELAHCLTHVPGIAGCLVAIPWLALTAAAEGDAWRLVGGLIFAGCALLMFSTSVAYHAASAPQLKTRLRTLDHVAIYLLIAGTYTPITIGVMRDGWGWSIFGVLWGWRCWRISRRWFPARPRWTGIRRDHGAKLFHEVVQWRSLMSKISREWLRPRQSISLF